jgi:hypothetical protein
MQEERASHSVSGKEIDMEVLEGTGNEEPDLEQSEGEVRESVASDQQSDLEEDKQGESLHDEEQADPHLLPDLEPIPGIDKKISSTNEKQKKRKTGKVSEKPRRTEKLKDHLPKKLLLDEPNSKTRREYKNYDEMLACLNLLKYMDWDKIDPKTHKNSPCKLWLLRHQPSYDSYELLVHGLCELFSTGLQVQDPQCSRPYSSRQAGVPDHDRGAAAPAAGPQTGGRRASLQSQGQAACRWRAGSKYRGAARPQQTAAAQRRRSAG